MMDFDTWAALLGTKQSDTKVESALTAAGVKKVPKPKYRDGESFVQIELKGQGLEVIFTDVASLEERDDEVGKGPLVVSGVLAKLHKSNGPDLYKGAIASGIAAGMVRDDVQKKLGKPSQIESDVDIWGKGKTEIAVTYRIKEGNVITGYSVLLPNATR